MNRAFFQFLSGALVRILAVVLGLGALWSCYSAKCSLDESRRLASLLQEEYRPELRFYSRGFDAEEHYVKTVFANLDGDIEDATTATEALSEREAARLTVEVVDAFRRQNTFIQNQADRAEAQHSVDVVESRSIQYRQDYVVHLAEMIIQAILCAIFATLSFFRLVRRSKAEAEVLDENVSQPAESPAE